MESHAFNPIDFTFFETFITNHMLFLLILFVIFICLQLLIVRHNFREDGQVRIQKLPGRLQDEVDALLREVDEVAEDDHEALQHVLLQVVQQAIE